jgi:hypothetical protein
MPVKVKEGGRVEGRFDAVTRSRNALLLQARLEWRQARLEWRQARRTVDDGAAIMASRCERWRWRDP